MIDCHCLKTGCALEIPGQRFWGDMHFFSKGVFIFNAVLGDDGEALHIPSDDDVERPTYYFSTQGNIFVRRGVFILSLEHLSWNEALRDYLGLSHLSGVGDGAEAAD